MNTSLVLLRAKQFDLECVESVDLSDTPLAAGLRKPVLLQCVALRELVLRGCRLETLLGVEAVAGSLQLLDVGNNKLTKLDPCASLTSLRELIADNNKISIEAVAALAPLASTLLALDLRGNPSSAVAAPGNVERTLAVLPQLTILDRVPAELQLLSVYQAPKPSALPKLPSTAWLSAGSAPTLAAPPTKPVEQLEAAVRRFQLVAQRAEDAQRIAKAAL